MRLPMNALAWSSWLQGCASVRTMSIKSSTSMVMPLHSLAISRCARLHRCV